MRLRISTASGTDPASLPVHGIANWSKGREVFTFYANGRFHQRTVYVTILNLWKPFGLEFLIILDNRYPQMRFLWKF